MRNNRGFILTATLVIGIFFASPSVYAADAGITGTWIMAVTMSAGTGNATFVLNQEGDAVTGTYKGSMGTQQVTGSCKDANVELNFTGSGMGSEVKVTYTGTYAGDTMTGKVKMGGFGEGTFNGKLQAAQ